MGCSRNISKVSCRWVVLGILAKWLMELQCRRMFPSQIWHTHTHTDSSLDRGMFDCKQRNDTFKQVDSKILAVFESVVAWKDRMPSAQEIISLIRDANMDINYIFDSEYSGHNEHNPYGHALLHYAIKCKRFDLAKKLHKKFHSLFNRDSSSLGVVNGRKDTDRNRKVVVYKMRKITCNGKESNVLRQPPLDWVLFSYLWHYIIIFIYINNKVTCNSCIFVEFENWLCKDYHWYRTYVLMKTCCGRMSWVIWYSVRFPKVRLLNNNMLFLMN